MNNTRLLICIMIGLLGLYAGQTMTGIPALVGTIVGFSAVLAACVLTFQRLIKKNDR